MNIYFCSFCKHLSESETAGLCFPLGWQGTINHPNQNLVTLAMNYFYNDVTCTHTCMLSSQQLLNNWLWWWPRWLVGMVTCTVWVERWYYTINQVFIFNNVFYFLVAKQSTKHKYWNPEALKHLHHLDHKQSCYRNR